MGDLQSTEILLLSYPSIQAPIFRANEAQSRREARDTRYGGRRLPPVACVSRSSLASRVLFHA